MGAASESTYQQWNPAEIANELARGEGDRDVRDFAAMLATEGEPAQLAARVLSALAEREPKLLGPAIPKLARHVRHPDLQVAERCGALLGQLVTVAPAKVAKQIRPLQDAFPEVAPAVQDAIVKTLVGLCAASVVYQRRLLDTLILALRTADLAGMQRWAELMLPALKGEPYASAREVVEQRLVDLPRAEGQRVSATLGVSYRGRPPA